MIRRVTELLILKAEESERSNWRSLFALHDEFSIRFARSVAEIIELSKSADHQLILLDEMPPDVDAANGCRLLRRHRISAPIIVCSVNAQPPDQMLCLDAGATDVVAKPFHFGVLLARIRAHLRGHRMANSREIRIVGYTLNRDTRCLHSEDQPTVRLTDREFEIITKLHDAPNYALSRDDLIKHVWGDRVSLDSHTLESHVYRLRQKLVRGPTGSDVLTVRRGVYKLNVDE